MKTNEIRIGDTVLVDSTPERIICINADKVLTDDSREPVAIEEVFPIPITDEELEKKEFVKVDERVYRYGEPTRDYIMARKDLDGTYAITLLARKGVGGFNLTYMHELEHLMVDFLKVIE